MCRHVCHHVCGEGEREKKCVGNVREKKKSVVPSITIDDLSSSSVSPVLH